MKHSLFVSALMFILLIVAGCGGEVEVGDESPVASEEAVAEAVVPPTTEEAAETISTSPEFGDFQFTRASLSLPMNEATSIERTRQTALDLETAGWIDLDADGNVSLTAKAVDDKRFIIRPNGFLDIVPLAKKEFLEVQSVSVDDSDDIVADFTWRWIPNEVAESFTSPRLKERFESIHQARATLMRTGDDWEVLLIETVESPEADESEDPDA